MSIAKETLALARTIGADCMMTDLDRVALCAAADACLARCPDARWVVDVGAYAGASAVLLAAVCRPYGATVVSVDPFQVHEDVPAHWQRTAVPPYFEKWAQRVREHGAALRVLGVVGKAPGAAALLPECVFILIDGDHSPQGIYNDLESYTSRLHRGGIVYLHDYGTHATIRQGVETWLSDRKIQGWQTMRLATGPSPNCILVYRDTETADAALAEWRRVTAC